MVNGRSDNIATRRVRSTWGILAYAHTTTLPVCSLNEFARTTRRPERHYANDTNNNTETVARSRARDLAVPLA